MLSDKTRLKFSEWLHSGKLRISELMSFNKQNDLHNLIGLVINSQYLELLKIKRTNGQYEVEFFNIIDLPAGLSSDTDIKDADAIADILKNTFNKSNLTSKNIVLSIPRSSAIVKSFTVDSRLKPDEIESRVWLEAGRLFPNLIGDIYLDFAINGPSAVDSSQIEILIVACRKDQIKPYLDIVRLAGLKASVIDINYYAYERALSLVVKHTPEIKNIALLNISFKLIDLLVIHEGKLVYTNELSYDGHNLLKFLQHSENNKKPSAVNDMHQIVSSDIQINEMLKNALGLHLKHTMQYFYSSKPNIRIERIILGGDAAAVIPEMCDYVHQELGKETVLANPFKDMKLAAHVDQAKLMSYAPGLMLCCGLALTNLI